MRNGSIYLVVRDFERSLAFYELVLDMKVTAQNGTRFAMFQNNGLNLCLMNGYYDRENPDKVIAKGAYYPEYDDQHVIADKENPRKVFINLWVEDLRAEYERIQMSGIAQGLTPIRYIEVFSPYWYFTFQDPDGNPIEITGGYVE
ncbi:MAG: VOC family protein [Clostridia bacterium]|nr:VOC family protein [Clostridia bacterium]